MGNAIEPLKAMADFIAPANTEHGVAAALAWILSTTQP
jgi:hydroxymethylpyrimidine pyrophosphatase-like HAD family hydrolase